MSDTRLQALLFDVDGTLADTEGQGHRPAYNQAFAALGLAWDWTPRLYGELLAVPGGRERIAYFLDAYAPPLGRHVEAIGRDRSGWIDHLHQLKTRFFRARLAAGRLALRPGIARLLASAVARGLPCALVTNASRASLALIREHLFDDAQRAAITSTACGDEVASKKPSADLYQLALDRLGVAPECCIAIEDAASGLRSATAAGIATVVAVNADTRDQDFAGARLVVSDLGDLGDPGAPASLLFGPAPPAGVVSLGFLETLL